MQTSDVVAALGAIVALSGAVYQWWRARSDNRKTNADAAGVLTDKALGLVGQYEDDMTALRTELRELRQANARLEHENTDLRRRVAELERHNSELTREVKRLAGEIIKYRRALGGDDP